MRNVYATNNITWEPVSRYYFIPPSPKTAWVFSCLSQNIISSIRPSAAITYNLPSDTLAL